jgi:hypothetical protein
MGASLKVNVTMVKPLHKAIAEVSLVALLGVTLGILISDAPINLVLLPIPQTSAVQSSRSPDLIQSTATQSTIQPTTTQPTTKTISK